MSIDPQAKGTSPELCRLAESFVFATSGPNSDYRPNQNTRVRRHDIRIPLLIAIVWPVIPEDSSLPK